jgi:hypothetical protein
MSLITMRARSGPNPTTDEFTTTPLALLEDRKFFKVEFVFGNSLD